MTLQCARAYDAGSSTPRDAAIDVAARHVAASFERSGALGYDGRSAGMTW
jgi:hypothetical protein